MHGGRGGNWWRKAGGNEAFQGGSVVGSVIHGRNRALLSQEVAVDSPGKISDHICLEDRALLLYLPDVRLMLHWEGAREGGREGGSTVCTSLLQVMMPVFWASEEGSLTHSLANDFKEKVYGAKYGIEAGVWAAVGIGGIVYMYMCNLYDYIYYYIHIILYIHCIYNIII